MRSLVAGVEAVLPNGSGPRWLARPQEGQSRLQPRPITDRRRRDAWRRHRRRAPAGSSHRRCAPLPGRGWASPDRAMDLLRFCEARTENIEGFELVPQNSLDLVIKHVPGTRAPLSGSHAWQVLIEATTADPQVRRRGRVGAAAWGRLATEASSTMPLFAANEAQAEAFWKIRDSISESERAEGQTLAHDISVAVADMPRFLTDTAAKVEQAVPGRRCQWLWAPWRWQHPFPRSRRAACGARLVRSRGPAITHMVDDLVTAERWLDLGRTWHWTAQARRIWTARAAGAGPCLAAIKQALDALGIMNPGKLIP